MFHLFDDSLHVYGTILYLYNQREKCLERNVASILTMYSCSMVLPLVVCVVVVHRCRFLGLSAPALFFVVVVVLLRSSMFFLSLTYTFYNRANPEASKRVVVLVE